MYCNCKQSMYSFNTWLKLLFWSYSVLSSRGFKFESGYISPALIPRRPNLWWVCLFLLLFELQSADLTDNRFCQNIIWVISPWSPVTSSSAISAAATSYMTSVCVYPFCSGVQLKSFLTGLCFEGHYYERVVCSVSVQAGVWNGLGALLHRLTGAYSKVN